MKTLVLSIGCGILVAALIGGTVLQTNHTAAQRALPTPSCFIGHLIWRKVQPLPSGENAMHFLGFLEDGELRITKFERSIPVWPSQEPHVLICVQFSPNDSAGI